MFCQVEAGCLKHSWGFDLAFIEIITSSPEFNCAEDSSKLCVNKDINASVIFIWGRGGELNPNQTPRKTVFWLFSCYFCRVRLQEDVIPFICELKPVVNPQHMNIEMWVLRADKCELHHYLLCTLSLRNVSRTFWTIKWLVLWRHKTTHYCDLVAAKRISWDLLHTSEK